MVDQSALGRPLHLYICSEQKNVMLPTDLQGLLSIGLRGLTEPADVTCLHIDRFDSRGSKSQARLSWDSIGVDSLLPGHQAGHRPPLRSQRYPITSARSHPAVSEGGAWWIFDDGNSPVKFDKVPLVVQENCCLLWLNCMPHGSA